jgi:CheY-like chemotaxis protein/HPt (histidine-containing phosphotransfer) domain-containing protein
VVGDRQRLEQALTNLLGNAIKFTATGSIGLKVQRELQDLLRFDVTDTGIGIAPSKVELIFEPFAQADGSITRHYGGTGLGLAITRSIARLMGGQVEVTSTPGLGSVFSLVIPLPAAPDLMPLAAPEETPALALRSSPRVLLAEDNEVNVYVFKAMLETESIVVEVAANGPTALDMARQRRYDIIFMDVQMPGLDGLSVTRKLREFEADSGRTPTPVVALTAHAFADDIDASRAAGCNLHLTKPFTKRQLLEAITEMAVDRTATPSGAMPLDALGGSDPVVDEPLALSRLGGDTALYERVRAHAALFIERWCADFDLALGDQRIDRARSLAHDLRSVAASVGAMDLAEAAARLEASITLSPTAQPDPAAHAAVRAAVEPVIVALSRASRP